MTWSMRWSMLLLLALVVGLLGPGCSREGSREGTRAAETEEAWRIVWDLMAGGMPVSGEAVIERAGRVQEQWQEESRERTQVAPEVVSFFGELLGAFGGTGGAGLLAGLAGLAVGLIKSRQAKAAAAREQQTEAALEESVITAESMKGMALRSGHGKEAEQALDEARFRQQARGVRDKINELRLRHRAAGLPAVTRDGI